MRIQPVQVSFESGDRVELSVTRQFERLDEPFEIFEVSGSSSRAIGRT